MDPVGIFTWKIIHPQTPESSEVDKVHHGSLFDLRGNGESKSNCSSFLVYVGFIFCTLTFHRHLEKQSQNRKHLKIIRRLIHSSSFMYLLLQMFATTCNASFDTLSPCKLQTRVLMRPRSWWYAFLDLSAKSKSQDAHAWPRGRPQHSRGRTLLAVGRTLLWDFQPWQGKRVSSTLSSRRSCKSARTSIWPRRRRADTAALTRLEACSPQKKTLSQTCLRWPLHHPNRRQLRLQSPIFSQGGNFFGTEKSPRKHPCH